MTAIYLAGKISKGDWRESVTDTLLDGGSGRAWSVTPLAVLGRFDYTGPYFTDLGHGLDHGPNNHGVGLAMDAEGERCSGVCPLIQKCPTDWDLCEQTVDGRRWFLMAKITCAIADADIVFAWIDSLDCYGTLLELGIAYARGKTIWIAGPVKFADLWLTYQIADARFEYATPREALLAFAATLDKPTFGSPIEARFWDEWTRRGLNDRYKLTPQLEILNGKYRLDFAHQPSMTAIELDGYEFHSDREQFTRDRRRQREIEQLGWRFIRFSGSEIHNGVAGCVKEAVTLIQRSA